MNHIIFIFGEDTYRSMQTLQSVKTRYLETQKGNGDLLELDGASVTLDELSGQIRALPFLSSKRMVIVKGLLKSKNKVVIDAIAKFTPQVPKSTLLIFYEPGSPDKRSAAYKHLLKSVTIKDFPPLSPGAANTWLKKTVLNLGGTITPEAIDLLVTGIGADLWALETEINKLITYNPQITLESVNLLTPIKQTIIIFRLTDEILANAPQKALKTLDQLRAQGEIDLQLMGLIIANFRNLMSLELAQRQNINDSRQLAQTLKIHPFVIQKLLPILRKTNLDRLIKQYQSLINIDLQVKSGKIESGPALDLLIMNLASS